MTGLSPVSGRVAVLVARAWKEAGGLRARLTLTRDIEGADDEVLVTASEDEVLATVRRWLDDVREGPGHGG